MKRASFFPTLAFILFLIPPLGHSADRVWLEWDANSEPDFSHYLVYRSLTPKDQPSDPSDLIASVEAPFYTDAEVQAYNTYYYWVCAVDLYGNKSACSGPLVATIVTPAGPSAFEIEHLDDDYVEGDPFIDRTLDNDTVIAFGWSAYSQTEVLYRIYLAENGGEDEFLAETEDTSFQIENAVSGVNYRLRVDVIDANQQIIARAYSEVILCEILTGEILKPEMPRAVNVQ